MIYRLIVLLLVLFPDVSLAEPAIEGGLFRAQETITASSGSTDSQYFGWGGAIGLTYIGGLEDSTSRSRLRFLAGFELSYADLNNSGKSASNADELFLEKGSQSRGIGKFGLGYGRLTLGGGFASTKLTIDLVSSSGDQLSKSFTGTGPMGFLQIDLGSDKVLSPMFEVQYFSTAFAENAGTSLSSSGLTYCLKLRYTPKD